MHTQQNTTMVASLQGKRILVTGASGYLATNLVHQLKNIECTLLRVSRQTQLPPLQGNADIIDIPGDIRTRKLWEQVIKDIDIVYHFAAQTSVYVANEDPFADWESNVAPMLHLLEVCRAKDEQPIIIFSGTVTEAGMPRYFPVDETHADHPATMYDLHKLMAEQYLKYYAQQRIVAGTSVRLANVYGPGPASSSADRAVINKMIAKALAGETLTVYGSGEYVRDYIYIEDAVSAFLRVPAHIGRLNGQHFVLGSGEGHTLTQAFTLVAERVAWQTGKQRVPVEHIPPPWPQSAIETRNFVADPQQFASATGWRAQYSLRDGIDQTVKVIQNG